VTSVVRRRTTPAPPAPEAVACPFFGQRHQRLVIGVDASLTGTALAFLDLDTEAWHVVRHRPKHKGVRRLAEIQTFVDGNLRQAKLTSDSVEHIVMEGYAFSRQMAHSIGEGGGAVKLVIFELFGSTEVGCPSIITSGGLKKFTVGSGKQSGDDRVEKSDMKLAVYKRWRAEFKDDNECDAFALAQVAKGLVAPKGLAQYQMEALAKVDRHAGWEPAR
jgi:hypothetical protein